MKRITVVRAVVVLLLGISSLVLYTSARAESVAPVHGVAMSGSPKYPAGFKHFDYVNPNAPKGGDVRLSTLGTYDTFNGFIPKGAAAIGTGLIYDTLLTKSLDEPFTEYGLLAEKLEMPADRSWITFHLNPKARFHDGKPVTAEDVVWTFNTLMEKGSPVYKQYYADVTEVKALDKLSVKFTFRKMSNPELPLILGQLTVLPKHLRQKHDFTSADLTVPVGSGPYRIADYKPGRSITYERVKDYWGKDLPVNVGSYNFDTIRYDYYRDAVVALEAFKANEYDFRQENVSKNWATGYESPALKAGDIIMEEIEHGLCQGMQGFVYNTRKDIFKDRKVREALAYAFDFEWCNQNLFYGQYVRSQSYFSNSELASKGLPGPAELELLNPYKDQLPEEVFTKEYKAPSTDGKGGIRANLRTAAQMLKKAGWEIKDGKLTNAKTGTVMAFEILLASQTMERVALPFKKNLERLGVETTVRVADTSQYINRIREFDFDMIVFPYGQSLSPGNEQRWYWHSESADVPDTYNFAGIKNPVVDAMVEKVITAPDRQALITACRALDRVLLWNHYLVPHYHTPYWRLAYWKKIKRPQNMPPYGVGFENWWFTPNAD